MSERLAGRYELLEPIGSGGMGQVWRARDTVLERAVAVKVLPEDVAAEPTRRQRFEREARAVARLSHPNIMAIYDFGTEGGRPYAVMELLEGGDLRKLLSAGTLPWRRALDLGLQVAHGLDAAHRQGVVHRDLKPTNLFLTSDGVVKLLDFGLARLAEPRPGEGGLDPTLTDQGVAVGTAAYMAPEQVRGRPSDVRSDLFSLGCVMYEMLSGRRAFQGGSSGEVMSAILRDEPDPLAPAVPAALRDVIARCLRKRAEDRFGSAAEVCAALEAIRSSDGAEPLFDGGSDRAGSRPRHPPRSRVVAWAAAAGLAGLVIAYAVVAWRPPSPAAGPRADLEPNRIAVVPLADPTGEGSLDALGRRAADRVIRELAEVDGLVVAPVSLAAEASRGRPPVGTEARALVDDVATATSSRLVLVGMVWAPGDEIELQATLENAASGRTVRSFHTLRSPREEVETSLDTLAGRVFISVMEELHPSLRFGAGDRIPDLAAYREFLSGLPLVGIKPSGVEHLLRALELDPEFDRIRLFGAVALWSNQNWQYADLLLRPLEESRSRLVASQQRLLDAARWGLDGRWGGSLGLLREYLAGHPDDCMARASVIKAAMFTNRPRLALQEFQDYRWDPVQPSVQMKIIHFKAAEAHHRLGQHEQELAVLRTLWDQHERFYGTIWYRREEARALAALGRIDECRQVIEDALIEPAYSPERYGSMMVQVAAELRVHGHDGESRAMAQRALDWFENTEIDPDCCIKMHESRIDALSILGRHEEAYQLATKMLEKQPDSWSLKAEVGVQAAWIGDRRTADEMSRVLAAVDEPFTMGWPSYHRAAIAVQSGEPGEALRLLRQAITRGFHDYELLHVDIDFDAIRDHPELREILRPKG